MKPFAIRLLFIPAAALAQAPATPPRPTALVNSQPRVDVLGMTRPIEMHDSVWIEDLTMMEVRDLIKGGKTTAVIMTGGIEENGTPSTRSCATTTLSSRAWWPIFPAI